MKRLVLIGLTLLLAGVPAMAQDGEEDLSNADVIAVLEEINEKMDRIAPGVREEDPVDFGGGPYFTGRYLLDMDGMSAYADDLGDYGSGFRDYMVPFRDGGGGTWRWTGQGNLSAGLEYYGAGQSILGQRNHLDSAEQPNRANVTVDENDDGLDDYYTYANYGYSSFNALVRYVFDVGESLFIGVGAKAGMGGESFSISQNDRSVLGDTFQIQSGVLSWSRPLATVGGFGGIQWRPKGRDGIFGMILDVGFDYHHPISDWSPEAGVHVEDQAPPEGFTPMNAWVTIGPSFNY